MFYDNGRSIRLLGIEALLCAFFIGVTQHSWGWFFGSLICSVILLLLPIVGGAIGIFISMILSYGIASFFSDVTTGWYIGIILFIILVYLNSNISLSGHILFGFSIVIFEAFMISGTLNYSTGSVVLPVILAIMIIVLAFIPLMRLIEYIVLSLITVFEIYRTLADEISSPHTYIISAFVLLLLIYYFYVVYIAIDYKHIINDGKKAKIIKKINKIYPQLEYNGSEYEHILNRCNGENERNSFLVDWDNYKLSIWILIKKKDKKQLQDVPFTFEEWYKANSRWRDTSYFHAYYEKQMHEERYIQNETERIRKLWVCEYCGRINSKNDYQCKACGALQKLVVPEKVD